MTQTEFQRLGARHEVSLLQVDLRHQQVGVCMRRTMVQAVLKAALSTVRVTWNRSHRTKLKF